MRTKRGALRARKGNVRRRSESWPRKSVKRNATNGDASERKNEKSGSDFVTWRERSDTRNASAATESATKNGTEIVTVVATETVSEIEIGIGTGTRLVRAPVARKRMIRQRSFPKKSLRG